MRVTRLLSGLAVLVLLGLGAALLALDPETKPLERAQAERGGSYADLPDGRVRYELVPGDPGEPLLVFVHGGALNSLAIWEPMLAALDRSRIGTLRFDSYGQGWSARPAQQHDAALYVRELDGLVELAGVERVHLVGYSLGGLIAAEYAAHRPQRVASLSLIAPAGLDTRLGWGGRIAAWPYIGEALFRLRGRALLLDRYARRTHGERMAAHVREAELEWLAIDGTGRSMLSQLRSLPISGAGAYRYVGASNVPTLAVFAREDLDVPASGAEALLAQVPGARVHVLADASHALVYDAADRVAPLVQSFVEAQAAAAP